MSPRYGQPSRPRVFITVALVIVGLLVILGLIGSWEPSAIAFTLITMVAGLAYLCYLFWQLATGRVGLIHRQPTARRRRRLERRAAQMTHADATTQQERLEAALSHGAYQPAYQSPGYAAPGSEPVAQARRELLEAVERHGSLSPEARTAAEKVRRLSR